LASKGFLSNNSGFTLLETLIAVTIMLIAFGAILSIQSNSINSTIRARSVTTVAMLLKDQMVQAELEIQGKTFDEVKKESGESFKPPFQDYRWTRVIKEIEFPTINFNSPSGKEGSSSNKNQEGSGDMIELITKLISQFLTKAVREVTVTIYFNSSGKEMSYSATTYWVDLNHEFQLSQ
jgi:prepilin-type N-terminal cleavage/methylation domain-containing protein